MPDARFNNQRLFSDYYLESVAPTLPAWGETTGEAAAARAELRATWENAQSLVAQHEGQTEEHWVRPVLRALGFSFQVQTPVADITGTTRWPDYALFANDADRSAAESHAGTSEYFRSAIGVADAKVWEAPL